MKSKPTKEEIHSFKVATEAFQGTVDVKDDIVQSTSIPQLRRYVGLSFNLMKVDLKKSHRASMASDPQHALLWITERDSKDPFDGFLELVEYRNAPNNAAYLLHRRETHEKSGMSKKAACKVIVQEIEEGMYRYTRRTQKRFPDEPLTWQNIYQQTYEEEKRQMKERYRKARKST